MILTCSKAHYIAPSRWGMKVMSRHLSWPLQFQWSFLSSPSIQYFIWTYHGETRAVGHSLEQVIVCANPADRCGFVVFSAVFLGLAMCVHGMYSLLSPDLAVALSCREQCRLKVWLHHVLWHNVPRNVLIPDPKGFRSASTLQELTVPVDTPTATYAGSYRPFRDSPRLQQSLGAECMFWVVCDILWAPLSQ